MSFFIKPTIRTMDSFDQLRREYEIGPRDLILSNAYVLEPHLHGQPLSCTTVYQEAYGAGEPNDEMIDGILQAIEGKQIDRVFAIGGGTILDIAKLLVFGDGHRCEALFLHGKELPKKRTLIAVPTTCGTGSEVTGISIAEIRSLHTKMGLVAPQLFPDDAVLIPALLETLPYPVFACSSIDALIHAVEAYVSVNANDYTDLFAQRAIETLVDGYRYVLAAEDRMAAVRERMGAFLTASNMAGVAFGNAGVGAVHALSYPIGANFHVPHGKANYLMFAACFRMYAQKGADLSRVERVLAGALHTQNAVWQELEALLDGILERKPLEAYGMTLEHLESFPATVLQTQQRLLKNMPVTLTEKDIRAIYAECMEA